MTFTISLPAELDARLQLEAKQNGLTVEECARGLLTDVLAEREAEDAEDVKEALYRLANPDPRPRHTLADFRAHIQAQGKDSEKLAA